MNIDLIKLYSGVTDKIEFEETIDFPLEYLENSDIKKLENIKVKGEITKNIDNEYYIECYVSGGMLLEDSISLKDVMYPFSIEINEKIEEKGKSLENTLDILDLLWENIVLEVPLKFTVEEDISKYKGDGWRLISEEDLAKGNNPFNDLLKEFGEE